MSCSPKPLVSTVASLLPRLLDSEERQCLQCLSEEGIAKFYVDQGNGISLERQLVELKEAFRFTKRWWASKLTIARTEEAKLPTFVRLFVTPSTEPAAHLTIDPSPSSGPTPPSTPSPHRRSPRNPHPQSLQDPKLRVHVSSDFTPSINPSLSPSSSRLSSLSPASLSSILSPMSVTTTSEIATKDPQHLPPLLVTSKTNLAPLWPHRRATPHNTADGSVKEEAFFNLVQTTTEEPNAAPVSSCCGLFSKFSKFRNAFSPAIPTTSSCPSPMVIQKPRCGRSFSSIATHFKNTRIGKLQALHHHTTIPTVSSFPL